MTIMNATTTYRNSSRHPIRFDTLHPGSYFRIIREPDRGIYHSRDMSIYQKARDGFYSLNTSNGAGCVLLPNDLVQPLVKQKNKK